MSKENNQTYHMVREFHKAFGHKMADKPTVIDKETAINRAVWTGEELVEFLYGTVGGDLDEFEVLYDSFKQGLDKAANKIRTEKKPVDDILVAQMDALIDVEYFNQGSFTIAGVEPFNLFKIVQEANMGKLFNDGKPRYREEDGKIIKPPNWEDDFAPEPRLIKEIERQKESLEYKMGVEKELHEKINNKIKEFDELKKNQPTYSTEYQESVKKEILILEEQLLLNRLQQAELIKNLVK
ncbi:HAD family hydrolase [Niallia circulans]